MSRRPETPDRPPASHAWTPDARRSATGRPLADFMSSTLGGTLAKRGFASGDILLAWDDIVGETLAKHCAPLKLSWPPRIRGVTDEGAQPATLLVRVEGAFALELQHRADQLIERINAYFGWACVRRIVIEQGRIERPRVAHAAAVASPELKQEMAQITAGIDDDALRDALARLGAAVRLAPGERTRT